MPVFALPEARWAAAAPAAHLDPANQAHTAAARSRLQRFEAPVLILWGAEDVHFPPNRPSGCTTTFRAPNESPERLVILPGTGHLLMEERTDQVDNLLAGLLTAQPAG